MIKNLLTFLVGLLCLCGSIEAQITNYSFSANTGTATAFVAITGTTASLTPNCGYTAPQGDEGYANAVPLGFTFNYVGVNYTTINLATNGLVTFGTSGFAVAGNCTYDNTN